MHPNATAAGLTAGLVSLAVYVAGRFGVTVSAQDAAAILGFATTLVLWVGKRGVKAAVLSLWQGSGAASAPPAEPPAAG